jgi:hypothetical protein
MYSKPQMGAYSSFQTKSLEFFTRLYKAALKEREGLDANNNIIGGVFQKNTTGVITIGAWR